MSVFEIESEINVMREIKNQKLKGFPMLIDTGDAYLNNTLAGRCIIQTELGNSMSEEQGKYLNRTLPLQKVIQIGVSITNSLKGLHSLGYVHRDIKADNVLLSLERDLIDEHTNGYSSVSLIDFGKTEKYQKENGAHVEDEFT